MKTPVKFLIVLLVVVAAALAFKSRKPGRELQATNRVAATSPAAATSKARIKLPKLIDLGATKCIPCKMMAPILESLKNEYVGRMDVEFIDVWENEEAGKTYGIEMIPTQIFYDAEGKELFRHTGFFGKDDILAKWKELGVDLGGNAL